MTTNTKVTREKVSEIAESLGWKVEYYTQTCINPVFGAEKEEAYAEFSQHSPAGEDFSFTVFFKSDTDIVPEVVSYAFDFDIDFHVEMWIMAKMNGGSGIPSARELVEDAEEIQSMLDDLARELNKQIA